MRSAMKMTMVKLGTLLVSLLAGMALVLSTSPVLAAGDNEKPKVEIIKVEKDKVEKDKVMLGEKKLEDKLGELGIHRIDLLLDEDELGDEILEDLVGIED